jgi:4-amino-4-deoxy-L-arabinose transferase-like glycosyltransferase
MTRALLITALAWIAAVIVINPVGDFPLNDDWVYGQAVRNLVEHGRYQPSDCTAVPLFTQAMWGTLFCLPAGFSFTALRFSTLVVSLAGLIFLLLFFRQNGEKRTSLLLPGLLVVLFNPIWFGLSHTFMTDVHFIAFLLGSLYLLAVGMEKENHTLLFAGMVFAVLATLVRQFGVLIPIAFGFAYLTRRRPATRTLVVAVLFLVLVVGAFLAYTRWLAGTTGLPSASNAHADRIGGALAAGFGHVLMQVAKNALTTFSYLGLFLLPLNLLLVPSASRRRLFLFLGISLAALALFQIAGFRMPGNVLSDRGLGPFTLKRPEGFASFSGSLGSKAVLGLLTWFGGTLLLEALFRIAKLLKRNRTAVLLAGFAACYFLSLSIVGLFDRYMLVYLPLVAVLTLLTLRQTRVPRWSRNAACAGVVIYGLFAVAATHDYLAWNRVRWKATRYLTEELDIPPESIDGGFEFNGTHTFSADYIRSEDKSWWWVRDDRYVVSFGGLPGYLTLRQWPTGTWLPGSIRNIHVLRRTVPATPGRHRGTVRLAQPGNPDPGSSLPGKHRRVGTGKARQRLVAAALAQSRASARQRPSPAWP